MATPGGSPGPYPVPPAGPPPWVTQERPVAAAGWQLFLAFAGLLLAAVALPLVTAEGTSSDPLLADPASALPLLVIAAGAFAAGLSGRQGYDVGIAVGGGAVAVFTVVISIVVRIVALLFDLSNEFGGDVTVGPGLVALGAAGVVGLFAVVPALKVALSDDGRPIHPLLAVGGVVGSALYLYGAFEPAIADDQPFWTGDAWTDVSIGSLIGALALGGLLVGLRRTGAACGFLGGVMLFPAASWLAALSDEPTTFETTSTDGEALMAIGLALALAVAVVGTFTAATRSRTDATGLVARVPAESHGALTAALAAVAIVALAGMGGDGTSGSGSGSDGADVFSSDESDPDVWSDDGSGSYFEDDFTGDGCPPPHYDCRDDGDVFSPDSNFGD